MKLKATLLKLEKNTQGRDFVVGDLHGHVTKLHDQLAALNFNSAVDRVICVGDLIDRGPESAEALNLLNEPWFFSVIGNHEYLMINGMRYKSSRHRMAWLNHGGDWITQTSPALWDDWFDAIEALPLAIEVEGRDGSRYGIIHADYPHSHWQEFGHLTPELLEKCIWSRSQFQCQSRHVVNGIDYLIHGHNVNGGDLQLGNRFYIERGAYLGNDLVIKEL
ncbi:MAG: metallophosphoesterase [Thalassolituus sp.]|uniref:metallophosphoesterase n=1 Tax=Thalassolituus sp. TaxID=2030822 RepID=UPI003982236D